MTKENTKIVIPEKSDTVKRLNRSKTEAKIKSVLVTIIRLVFLISVGYIILYPLFAMFSYSFQSLNDLYNPSVIWLPRAPTFENFVTAWDCLSYLSSLKSTLLNCGVAAMIEVFTCAVAAYGFARFEFKGRGLLFSLVLLTAIVPVQVLAIPLYLNFRFFDFFGLTELIGGLFGNSEFAFDLTNTVLTFWIPSIFGVGLRAGIFIFIYRQFFLGLPKELEEASWIDGCGPFKTFLSVVIPSSGVVFLTVTIFSVIWHWNEYFLSVLYFQTERPLAVALSNIGNELESRGLAYISAASPTSAACLLFIAPVLIMFILLQKKFIQSIDRVGIVG